MTRIALLLLTNLACITTFAQEAVKFITKNEEKKIDVLIDGKFFTSYIYPDNIDKPVLYPLVSSSGITLTRGFPLQPRANERTDHPHHIGLWFNYGNVNGFDFWNNSYAIKPEDKPKYGMIKHRQVLRAEDGVNTGTLIVAADWMDHSGKILLKEVTKFVFSGNDSYRTIERTTTLTAQNEKVNFTDNKEGMLGVRVCRELEIPADRPEIFTDAQGNPTSVPTLNNEGVTGTYLSSAGKKGDSVWGTRGSWCLMYGKKNNRAVSIGIIDHPSNPGYPTYWHARGYGLFAANTLGQEALSNGKEKLNFSLEAGKSASFRYKIIFTDGIVPAAGELNKMAADFASVK